MPFTDPTKPLCTRCEKRNAQVALKGLCNRCYQETKDIRVPRAAYQLGDIGQLAAAAKTDDEWKKLALQLQPVIVGIADGTVKATAAQASIVKHIMDRAFGKVTKSQEDAKGPIGVVVLPTLSDKSTMLICLKCQEEHARH